MSISSRRNNIYMIGQTVVGESGRTFKVVEAISSGGYGAVYRVKASDDRKFALKVEKRDRKRDHYKLMMEERILLDAKRRDLRKHFPAFVDRKQVPEHMFIIMTLLGQSLADVKRKRASKVFSLNTGYYCAVESLEAIMELHKMGYVHRDIKPANFILGCPGTGSQNNIFIVDFGIARRYVDENGSVHTPRPVTKFKGTVRFAPLISHQRKEFGVKDDCESWVWMVVDMVRKERLPWHAMEDPRRVEKCKEEVIADPELVFEKEQHELSEVLKYIAKQHYVDRMDYDWMRNMVLRVAKRAGCDLDLPYDWNLARTQRTQRE